MSDLSSRMMSLDKTTRGMELMSLQAIYPDEFETVEDATAAADERAFRLRVRPEIQFDMNFTEVDLVIALGPDYPDTEASLNLSVMPVLGLSPEQLTALEQELRTKIAELVGREMVFELAQAAQDFLRKYNVDPKKSIHDEMMEQQQRQEKQEELAARERAKQEREEARQLQQIHQEQIKVEMQEERQRRKKLFRPRGKKADRKLSGDLWGSSEEEMSWDEDEYDEEEEEEADGGESSALIREPSQPSMDEDGEGGNSGALPEEPTTPGGGSRMRWKVCVYLCVYI